MIVTQVMQDKAMRLIIDYYSENPHNIINETFLSYKNVCKESEVHHLIDVLCAKNLIIYDLEEDMRVIRLQPNGKKYFEVNAEVKHEKRVESIRYIITTAIAVSALITAIVSIVLQYI